MDASYTTPNATSLRTAKTRYTPSRRTLFIASIRAVLFARHHTQRPVYATSYASHPMRRALPKHCALRTGPKRRALHGAAMFCTNNAPRAA